MGYVAICGLSLMAVGYAHVVAQFLARDALNQALIILGFQVEESLHNAIGTALGQQVITEKQARSLRILNHSANEAKHGSRFCIEPSASSHAQAPQQG